MVLRVVVPADEVEMAADALWVAGASAVAEADVAGGIELTADVDACPAALASFAHDLFADDGSWRDGWRPFARAVEVGPFVVRPPWVPEGPSRLRSLLVDAGHAFGTGSHPSTTLALAALAEHVGSGRCRSVLDVGCGSGVLAIGAALLGAAVVAIDVDRAAIDAAVANAAANAVAFSIASVPLADLEGRFELVAANLGSPLVVDLAPLLVTRTVDIIVLSGLLEDRWEHVPPAYPDFEVVDMPTADGWRALVLARAAGHGGAVANRL
jgi:ribosomal protein L11 methyltransferase